MAVKKRYIIGAAALVVFGGLMVLRSAMTTAILDMQKIGHAPTHFATFEVGDCMKVPFDAVTTRDMLKTDCGLEHDAEIFAIKRPQDKTMVQSANTQVLVESFCNLSFIKAFKISVRASKFDVWAAYGETLDFQQGASTIICFASLSSGDTMKTSIKAAIGLK